MYRGLKKHITSLLQKQTRLDGRGLTDYRNITVEKGFICTAHGSARVTIGDTEVIAGVKMEVATPYPDKPKAGSIMVGAELLPLSSPEFELGPPGIQAVELARVVDRGIREGGAVDFEKLCIVEGEKVWFIVVDVCSINDDGNLFDAAALATIAALQDTKLPALTEDNKIDYENLTDQGLPLDIVPISITVNKIGKDFIVDPLPDEEKTVDARLTVASMEDGRLCAMQKGGNEGLDEEQIMHMVDLALEKSKELRAALG